MGRGCKRNYKRGASELLVRYDRMALADVCDVKAGTLSEVFLLARSFS